MKPRDIVSPYPFERRFPLIQGGIFYVPTYYFGYDAFEFPSWRQLFGNENPVRVEYCSGNGEWILSKAVENPQVNWIAVDIKFNRVRKIRSKQFNRKIENVFIICGEAQIFTREYLFENSVELAYVNFPDPWPKGRHAKHRLIQVPFMRDVLRSMKPDGQILLVSDAHSYIEQMREEVQKVKGWKRIELPLDQRITYGGSYFERLWRSKGRSIHFLGYQCEKS